MFPLAAALVIAAWLAAAAPAQARYVRLSDERTHTRWSYVTTASVVRAKPSHDAKRVGRVRTRTFIDSREVVIVLGRQPGWSRVRYPRLGNQTGWVPTRVLGPAHLNTTLAVIDTNDAKLRAYRNGKLVTTLRVGVGATASPTPRGRFYIRERVRPADQAGPYGILAFGMSAYSEVRTDWIGGGQVAIHGTNEPQLIPGHVSNGCIRVRNAELRRLARIVGVGTPIRVR